MEVAQELTAEKLTIAGSIEAADYIISDKVESDLEFNLGKQVQDNSSVTSTLKSNKIYLTTVGSQDDINISTSTLKIGDKSSKAVDTVIYGELEVSGDFGAEDIVVGNNVEVETVYMLKKILLLVTRT